MKKIRLIFSILGITLGVSGGLIATKTQSQVQKANASISEVTFQFKDYQHSVNDPATCTYAIGNQANYTPSNGSWSLTNIGTNQYRVQYTETSSSQEFYYYTALVKIRLSLPSYSHSNVTLNFTSLRTECSTTGSPDHAAEITVWPESYVNTSNTYLDFTPRFTYNPNNSLDGQPSTDSFLRIAYQGSTASVDPARSGSTSVRVEFQNEVMGQSTDYRNIYFAFSGYVESTSKSGGHIVTQSADFTISETNTGYVSSFSQGNTMFYYDNFADAISKVNQVDSSSSPKITLYRDFSSVSVIPTSSFVLDLNGHNLHFSGTQYGVLARQENGLKKNITIELMNSANTEKFIYGNFADSVFILGNASNTYTVTLTVGSYVTIQNNGAARGVGVHKNNRIDLISDAAKIVAASGNAIYCDGGIVNCLGGTLRSDGHYAIKAENDEGATPRLYFGGNIQFLNGSGYSSIGVAGSNTSVEIYSKTLNMKQFFRA